MEQSPEREDKAFGSHDYSQIVNFKKISPTISKL